MYTLGAGRILIKSILIVCLLNLMPWKASWAHRTGENEKKKDNDKIKNRSKRRAPVAEIALLHSRFNLSITRLAISLHQTQYRNINRKNILHS